MTRSSDLVQLCHRLRLADGDQIGRVGRALQGAARDFMRLAVRRRHRDLQRGENERRRSSDRRRWCCTRRPACRVSGAPLGREGRQGGAVMAASGRRRRPRRRWYASRATGWRPSGGLAEGGRVAGLAPAGQRLGRWPCYCQRVERNVGRGYEGGSGSRFRGSVRLTREM